MTVRRSILAVALLAAVSTTLVGCNAVAADGTSPPASATPSGPEAPDGGGGSDSVNPDDPVGGQPPAADPGTPGDGALHVEPEPGIVDPIPHAWDHITVAPDGRTITVYYWGGVEACYGLARVEVERDADGLLVVRVLEGRRGNLAPDTACIEIALLKAVTVTLEEPLVAPAA